MANKPNWSNAERQHALLVLFVRSGAMCVFGHSNCLEPSHYYESFIEGLIEWWKEQDREQAATDWQAEASAIHSLGETHTPIRGRFNNIGRDIYHGAQPLFFIERLGMDCLRLKPFAKVKVASSYMRLHVDISETVKHISRHARRKAIRYGKPLPQSAANEINSLVTSAVRDYLNH